jgi:hypothetical protein
MGSNRNYWVSDFVRLPEFQNLEFRIPVLEFRTMDKVQKPSDSEGYAPSSEPFRFHKLEMILRWILKE